MCSDLQNARCRISFTPFGLTLPTVRAEPVEALFRFDQWGSLLCPGAALSPRRATYFSLSRQRNLRKRKATLVSASLRFAAGNLRCSLQAGSCTNSPAAQTSTRPDPPEAPLLGAFTRVWGTDSNSESTSRQAVATIFIAASARFTKATGLKYLEKRLASG